MLLTSEGKYRFQGIFIWFDRARRALQEYECQKNSGAVSNSKLEGNQKSNKNSIYLALERVC